MKMLPPLVKQIWVLLGIVLVEIYAGAQLGLVGCIVHGAVPASDPIPVSTRDSSWIASAHAISLTLSIPLVSYMMNRVGRRASLATTTLIGFAASLIISRAASVTGLVIGRLIIGIALDALCLGAIITAECSAPKYRGVFLNLKSTAMVIGSSIMHFLNYYFDWRTLSFMTAAIALAALAIISSCPESPHWYILKNRFKEAEKSFFWFRGQSVEAEAEFKALVSAQKLRTKEFGESSNKGMFSGVLLALKSKDFQLPLFAIYLSSILLEATGRHTFITFAVKLIGDIVGDNEKSSVYLAFIDVITILSLLFSCILAKLVPRRVLMFFSGLTAAIMLSLFSLYLYLESAGLLPVPLKSVWIPMMLLSVFFLLVNVGCVPICIAMRGELLPLAHKALGVIIAGFTSKSNTLLTMMLVPYLLESIKVQGTFALSALMMILSLIGLYFTLHETKDRTLQDIENGYSKKKMESPVNSEELNEMISK